MASLEQKEANGGDHRCACRVKEPFQRIDPERVGNRQAFFLREQKRSDGFSRSAQQKYGGKSGQRHAVNIAEVGRPKMPGKTHPAQRPQRVTGINRANGEQQQRYVRLPHCRQQFCATEAGFVDKPP